MDATIVIGIVTVLGALMGTAVPYTLKVWKDPNLSFDVNFFYALVLGILIQAGGLIPDYVPALTVKNVIAAFMAGYGLQTMLNTATPKSAPKEGQ